MGMSRRADASRVIAGAMGHVFALGLEDNDAFEKAVQSARQLPDDLGPDGITLSRTGEWIVGYSQPAAAAGS